MATTSFSDLHSDHLILRRVRDADAKAISSYRSLPEVARFQSWTTFDETAAVQMINEQVGLEPNTPGTWFQLVITDKGSHTIIGDLALHFRSDDERQVEIGVNLSPAHQHRGLAAEAVLCVLSYMFEKLDKYRVTAVTDAANNAAAHLFRRLGFREEGHFVQHLWFKGAYGSEYLFAMLEREWAARQPNT